MVGSTKEFPHAGKKQLHGISSSSVTKVNSDSLTKVKFLCNSGRWCERERERVCVYDGQSEILKMFWIRGRSVKKGHVLWYLKYPLGYSLISGINRGGMLLVCFSPINYSFSFFLCPPLSLITKWQCPRPLPITRFRGIHTLRVCTIDKINIGIEWSFYCLTYSYIWFII